MITDFRISHKTKHPACCGWGCCGNKFGRIERKNGKIHTRVNRIVLTRRYAKHVERQIVRKLIVSEMLEQN